MTRPIQSLEKQTGAVLIVSLLFVFILALIGVSSTQTASLELKMAANSRDKNLAFQSAEAALVDAENYLNATSALPDFDGSEAGLIQAAAPESTPVWSSVGWQDSDSRSYSGTLEGVGEQPRYIVEELPPMPMPGGTLQSNVPLTEKGWYRITARATGATSTANVLLQSVYKR
ncbi:MAG TPA: hypothetical protein ENK38_04290 [Gammaproteobacteria bacterium]|nr:hypothetical protein [Gammaproteobacteria bacterium]